MGRGVGSRELTILHLADTRLEVIQGQVADLVFDVGEIHDAMSPDEKNPTLSIGSRAKTGRRGTRARRGGDERESRKQSTIDPAGIRRWAPRDPVTWQPLSLLRNMPLINSLTPIAVAALDTGQ